MSPESSKLLSRRKFLTVLSAVCLAPACKGESAPAQQRQVLLGPIVNFTAPITPMPLYRVLIRNDGSETNLQLRALSLICTHQECAVAYRNTVGDLQCRCHGSRFTLEGGVLSGPAELDLHWHEIHLLGNDLVVHLDTKVPRDWKFEVRL